MSTYTGTFDNKNWYRVFKDGKLFNHNRSYKYITHSPDGFSWGYMGSGPSQLAFGLLLDATDDPKYCMKAYQDFKFEVVSRWPVEGRWSITTEQIMEWITEYAAEYGFPKAKK